MFMTRLVIATVACVCAVAAIGRGAQQTPAFRSSGDTVPVYVTVTDKQDRLVPTLERDAFQVLDNGRAQPLTLFDNAPQPIRLLVMLDVSGSMAGNLGLLRAASVQLFARLQPGDLARVGTFGNEIRISPTFTRDRAALEAALPRDVDPDAPTPLWRAVDAAIVALADADARPVVLVLSDGKDGAPGRWGERYIGQVDVVDHAIREDVMIYGVGLRSRALAGRVPQAGANLASLLASDFPDPGLSLAARDTGGGYFEMRPRDDLGATFARVLDELHTQYLLGFATPARDGKLHKIEVKVAGKDLEPRARRSYRAPK
jgi:VWFA-related protein